MLETEIQSRNVECLCVKERVHIYISWEVGESRTFFIYKMGA